MFLIVLFAVIISVAILISLVISEIIFKKAIEIRKEQNELYKKQKAIIENQYEELKNKE